MAHHCGSCLWVFQDRVRPLRNSCDVAGAHLWRARQRREAFYGEGGGGQVAVQQALDEGTRPNQIEPLLSHSQNQKGSAGRHAYDTLCVH